MIRFWPVQQAVYQAMTADATLVGMVSTITDEPEQNQAFPYILIGEATGTPEDLLKETGGSQTLTIYVWDRDAAGSRLKQILDRLIQTLHYADLAPIGTQAVQCYVEFSETRRDYDARQAILRLRVVTFG